ncbi:MgtC/SapB family protein [Mesonia maritima]|uniref:MgtC/SapB family protein n=1 Tax=Mesonia maritima TaxID=1793873 RepID=UPI0036329D2D
MKWQTKPGLSLILFLELVFLGAGIIFFRDSSKNTISGLTTAATIWASAGVGIAIGYGMYLIGITSTLLIILLLVSHHFPFFKTKYGKGRNKM